MAGFSDIIGVAQQGQAMPAAMPYVQGFPQDAPAQVPVQAPDLAAQEKPPEQTPPANPQEFEERKSGWKTLLDGFMAQPNAKEVMMLVALKLLQGRRPGQSVGSQFAEAAGTGLVANQMYKDNLQADAEKAKAQEREDQKFQLEMRRGTAQANKAEAENDFYTRTRAQALDEINLGIENLKRQGRHKDAQIAEQEWQNGNLKVAWDLTRRDKESSIWARNAQVQIQRQNAAKVPSAQQAKRDVEDLIKRANPIMPGETPQAYDQRIAQLTLGQTTTSKSNSATDWVRYADTLDDGPERENALAQAKAALEGRKVPVGVPTPTGQSTKSFATKAEFVKAANAKQVKIGDTVLINGKKFVVKP